MKMDILMTSKTNFSYDAVMKLNLELYMGYLVASAKYSNDPGSIMTIRIVFILF